MTLHPRVSARYTRALRSVYFRFAPVLLALGAVLYASARFYESAVSSAPLQTQPAFTSISAASFETNLTPEGIAAGFGSNLAPSTVAATTVPLPTTLAGVSVTVNGVAAGLFFVAAGQINYLVPAGTAAGEATVNVLRNGAVTHTGKLNVFNAAPAIFTANASGTGVPAAIAVRVLANGMQSTEAVAQRINNQWITRALNLGPTGERVFLILFLCGLRGLPNSDGNNGNGVAENVRVLIGGLELTPSFAGRQGSSMAGIDQLNVELPRALIGRGRVKLIVQGGARASNEVEIELAGERGSVQPVVTNFTPANPLAGETLTISGSNFAATAQNNTVIIGGNETTIIESAAANQLIARVPFGAESGRIVVRTKQGEGGSSGNATVRTSLSGVVTDTNRNPLPGVEVSYGASKTTTRKDGTYVLPDLTPGFGALKIDPSKLPLNPPMQAYSRFARVTTNRDSFQGDTALQPITGAAVSVQTGGSNAEEESALLSAERLLAPAGSITVGGVTFSFPDNTVATFPAGTSGNQIFLTLLANGHTPEPLPAGIFSSTIAQLTPFGVKLNPGGKLSFPNADGLPANAQARLYKLDQTSTGATLGKFVEVGAATVSADGQRVETAANAITETSIYFVALPRSLTTVTGRVVDSDGTTPVRRALVSVSGQEGYTDGNGGFVLRNVALPTNNQLRIEASFTRPNGRTDRVVRTGLAAVANGITRVAPDLVLPSPATQPNRLPSLIAPAAITLIEGQIRTDSLLVNDPDAGQTLTVTVTGAAFASIVQAAGGHVLRLAPGANTAGNYTLTVRAADNQGGVATANVAVTVNRSRPPVLTVPGAQTVLIGQPLAFNVSAVDPDEGQTLTLAATNLPSGAMFNQTGATTGRFTWTPNANQAGSFTVNFKASDNGTPPLSDMKSVLITVPPNNRPPVAIAQNVTTAEDAAKQIVLAGSDPDNDPLSFIILTRPTRGTLAGTGANLTYTPSANLNGADSFTFKVNDGKVDSAPATVSINVTAVNDAPVLTVPGAQIVNEGQPLNFTITATDVDAGQTKTFSATGLPSGATLNPTTGAFSWTSSFAQAGTYILNFTVTDNGTPPLNDSETVRITVNEVNTAPTAANKTVTTNEDTLVQLTLSGTDPQNDPLTFAIVAPPANGTLGGTAPNLTFTPAANFNGTATFNYKANDGKLDSALATVTITVTPVNDAPVANNQTVQVTEDTPKQITLSATDVDGSTLTYAVVTPPSKGALGGTAPNLTYTPNANATGADSFTFRASDGTANSNTATVSISIGGVNDRPIANNQTVTTNEDTAKQISLTGSDPDGGTLTYTVVTLPTKGALNGAAPNLTYTPAANVNGTDSFTFKVNDGTTDSNTATVSITITPVNDAPVLTVPGAQMVNEGVLLEFTVSATDADAGQSVTLSAANLPVGASFTAATGHFSWTPAFNQAGSHTVSFTATDNGAPALTNTKTVAITVKDARRAPVANAQSVTTNEDTAKAITLVGSDPDNLPITYSVVTPPAHGTLTGTAPNVTYTPVANYNGADTFTFKVNNGSLDSNTATVSLTITPVNDAPVLNVPGTQTGATGQALSFDITASDPDQGQTLNFTSSNLPSGATLTKTNATTARFNWTPSANQAGSFTVNFTVTDNGTPAQSNTKAVTINVAASNRPPVANAQTVTTNEDAAKQITLAGSDPDNDTLSFIIVTQPMRGTLTGTGANLTYTPTANLNGADSFTFKVNDGKVDSAPATVSITVTPINDKPVVNVPGAQSATTSAQLSFTITASDVDTGQTFTFAATSLPSGASLNATSGVFTWTPASTQTGTFTVSFTATDNGTPPLTSDAKTVTITVSNTTPPTANAQTVTTNEDTAKAITLTGSDSASRPLTYTVTSQPANGALAGTAPNLTYTPAANFNGTDSFKFRVNNGQTNSSEATITINITPVNDAPVANAQTVTTNEDTAKQITLTGSDPDNNTLSFIIVTQPTNGALTGTGASLNYTPTANFNGADSFTFKVNDGQVDSAPATVSITVTAVNDKPIVNVPGAQSATTNTQLSFTITASDVDAGQTINFAATNLPSGANLNATSGVFTWTPAPTQTGTFTVSFTATDNGTPPLTSDAKTVTITVSNTAPPVADAQTVTTNEDTAKAITLTGSDSASRPLTYTVTSQPTNGALAGTAPNLTYTPAANFNGTDSFKFRVNNGQTDSSEATVTINVTAVNDAPVLTVPGAQTVATEQALSFTVSATDVDTGQTVTLAATNLPSGASFNPANGQFSWTPAANQAGSFTVTFTATDNGSPVLSDTATVTITVGSGNRPPVANAQTATTNEDTAKPITLTGSDPDNDTLNFIIVTQPTGGTLSGTGASLTYTPTANLNGADSFTFKVNDGQVDSAPATVSITVTAVSDAPVLTVPGAQTATTGQALSFDITASDPDQGQTLSFTSNNLPSGATLTTTNATTARFNWTPSTGQTGTFTVNFTVTDNDDPALSDTESVTINVTGTTVVWMPTRKFGGAYVYSFLATGGNLFVGTFDGTFRSTDGGLSWSSVNIVTGNAVVYSFAATNTALFAGTNDGKVYRSTDNGVNWTVIYSVVSGAQVNALAAIGTNVFAAIGGEVHRGSNNGETWVTVNNGLGTPSVSSLAVIGTTLFAGAGNGVFRTTDNGANWTQVNESQTSALVANGTTLYASLGSFQVSRSTDNGANWSQLGSLPGYSILSIAVNGANVFAATTNGIYRTTDDGVNWTEMNNGLDFQLGLTALTFNGATLLAGTSGGVYGSTDNGANWTHLNNGIGNAYVTTFAVSGNALFAGALSNGVYRSTDGASNWALANKGLPIQSSGHSFAISGSNLFVVSNAQVFRTTDNGANWTAANNGLGEQTVNAITALGSTLLAGTSGGVYRSTNNGDNWVNVLGGRSVSFLATVGTTVYASTDLGLYRTTDNGDTWGPINNGLGATSVVSVVAINTTLFAGTASGIYRSTDNGANWAPVFNIGVNALAVNGTTLFAGAYNGVQRTTDTGANWTEINDGLTNPYVTALVIFDNKLFAGVYNLGTALSSVFVRPL
jgi:photosystem II stability/assembly factor-like uncharacterized protein